MFFRFTLTISDYGAVRLQKEFESGGGVLHEEKVLVQIVTGESVSSDGESYATRSFIFDVELANDELADETATYWEARSRVQWSEINPVCAFTQIERPHTKRVQDEEKRMVICRWGERR